MRDQSTAIFADHNPSALNSITGDFTNQNATQFGNTETEKGPGRERRHERGKTKLWMRTRRQPRGRAVQILQNQLTNKFSFYSWHEPYKMATWEALLFAYQDGSIDDTELALLYDFNSSENLEFPYWKYGRFDLDSMTDDECKIEFRFFKNDIYLLGDVFGIPDIMKCPNGVLVDGMKALSVLLKRFAYPCRFADMIARFGRPVPQLCMITNRMMDYIFDEYSHLLADLNQPWLSRDRLRHVAATIHDKGAPLENFWGLIDGTVRPLCKPDQNQRILYNGHKRVHGIKFQSAVVAPNVLIVRLFERGRKSKIIMLVSSDHSLKVLNQYFLNLFSSTRSSSSSVHHVRHRYV